jgi:hypothetical protein
MTPRFNAPTREKSAMNEERDTQPNPDSRIIEQLIDEHAQFDCDIVAVDAETWAIHGSIAVSGDVILAEFSDESAAKAALERLSAAEDRIVGS